ncbi:hypothetical protein [Desulforamulus aquiferis]|uniref:Uncharacterized protein n=1 Tax=Desulforamulus aquiferis TaxID=1397668 RepID=A0AAW7ZGC8_9FIRM|nr:hypothetical protein [Desulforamulus aquiferis]MDO7788332.1 hypothetical protein [Desulforamulus aquiferis]
MKTWYVEDAGGGCRAFGEVVVLVCEETREIYSARIPVTWTNKMGWEELVCQLMLGLMKEAQATSEDKYLVCSGNIFNVYHNWLKEHNYNWETHKMDGLAHEAAEGEFHRMVVEAGFPEEIKLEERDYRSYYSQIEQWVNACPERKKLYWKDREVRKKPSKPRYILKSTMARTRTCRHCQKVISPFSPVVELKIRQEGRKQRYFYHPGCSPAKPLKTQLNLFEIDWNGGKLTGIIVPCPETIHCSICGQPIDPGQKTFYAYDENLLICGHPACFEKSFNNNRAQTI